MTSPTDHDMDDLFGPEEPQQFASTQPTATNDMNNFLPMPAAPVQEVSANVAYGTQSQRNGSVPEFTEEQRRQLWGIIQASQNVGMPAPDSQQLVQQFVANHNTSLAHQPVYTLQAPNVPIAVHHGHNVALPTQCQPKINPPPAGAKISHARDKNGENRIGQYDWYDEFPSRPNWTARDGNYQIQIKYSKQGELKPMVKFDRQILEAYIRGCAQQGISIRMWIQNSATMHTDRFPSRASSMCRSAKCPVRNSTIARGMYQVCFDEHPTETSNGRYDPFFVAGYMHLFCLEEMIPMAELMTFADVQPDIRDFPLEQRNPMSLNRDGAGRTLLGAYNEWKGAHYDRFVYYNISIPKTVRKSSDCLYKFLTVKKMETQPSTRQKMRDQRNGFDISKHCGNLRKLVTHKADVKKKRKLARCGSEDSSGVDADADFVFEIDDHLQGLSPKRSRTTGTSPQPTLTTTTQAAPVCTTTPSPLRRSRRLSSAMAGQSDSIPAPPPGHYLPYNNDQATLESRALSRATHGLNVYTGPASLSLDNVDFSTVDLDQAAGAFGNAYNTHMHQQQQAMPLAGSISPGSPYRLRDTQARRESAFRQLSARTAQLNHHIHHGLVDPRLLQNYGPVNSSRLHQPSVTSAPAAAPDDVAAADALLSPTRRVTRSMSRHSSASTPEQQEQQQQEATPVPLDGAAVEQNTAVDPPDQDYFADIDYDQIDQIMADPSIDLYAPLPEGYFDQS